MKNSPRFCIPYAYEVQLSLGDTILDPVALLIKGLRALNANLGYESVMEIIVVSLYGAPS